MARTGPLDVSSLVADHDAPSYTVEESDSSFWGSRNLHMWVGALDIEEISKFE
jgi:hypothetical protein